jgi:hypothetical protein
VLSAHTLALSLLKDLKEDNHNFVGFLSTIEEVQAAVYYGGGAGVCYGQTRSPAPRSQTLIFLIAKSSFWFLKNKHQVRILVGWKHPLF